MLDKITSLKDFSIVEILGNSTDTKSIFLLADYCPAEAKDCPSGSASKGKAVLVLFKKPFVEDQAKLSAFLLSDEYSTLKLDENNDKYPSF